METITVASRPAPRALPMNVILSLLAVYVIWGSTYFAIRVAVGTFPPLLMSGTRFLVAGGLLLTFLRLRGEPWPSRRQWLHSAIVGALLLGGGNGGVAFAEQYVSSSLAAAIVATSPLWVALFSGGFGHWPRRVEWLGILLGLAGVILLNSEGQLRASPLGALVLTLAPISWALGSVLSPRLDLPKGLMGSAAEMLAGGPLLLILGLARGETLSALPSSQAWLAWGYLIVFGSLVAFSAYMFLIRTVRPALATSYAYVNPTVALGLGLLLGGEKLSWLGFAGISVILAGVVLMVLGRGRAAPAAAGD